MRDFVFFLGRFHVLVLHLPIAISIAAVALDWIARRARYAPLAQASPFLWGAAAVSAVATAVLGYLHFAEGSFLGPAADAHRLLGTLTALACVAVWWLATRTRVADAVRLGAGIAALVLVTLTGHYGGNLTHGNAYLLRPLLGGPGFGDAPAADVATAAATADAALVQELVAAGFLVRQVSQADARLVVSPGSPGMPLGTAGLEALAAASGTLVDLNLANSDLDDTELASLGALPAVTHLRLARNRLTDAALPGLQASPELVHLNLYGNTSITDAGIDTLAEIAPLRDVYLWQTGITTAGVARLRARRPDLVVEFGAAAPP